jgi:phosphoglycerate dehydrogenase-like enzyme
VRRAVVDLTSTRASWSIPRWSVAAIRAAFGRGWDVVEVTEPSASDGDGSGGSRAAREAIPGAEVYFGWGISPALVRVADGTLRWAHSAAAGVGSSVSDEFAASGAVLTNSRAVQAEPMADWVVAAMGYCLRGFHALVEAQRDRRWIKGEVFDGEIPVQEFAGSRVGIVGLGGIGKAVAKRCRALGMEVRAIRRRPARRRMAGLRWVGGAGDAVRLASTSHVLVVAAPQTGATRHLVDDAVLAALPRGAYVINVSRGALVDEDALLCHLDRGHLGGCVLDVFRQEPLPARHPFWGHPRVLVSPHVSCVSDRFWEREMAVIEENIRRYRDGRRLKNVVDLEAGY